MYLHYPKIYWSDEPAPSTPLLQSMSIHFIVCRMNWTTCLMSAGSQEEHISSAFKICSKTWRISTYLCISKHFPNSIICT
ncbi:hypothetical protein C0J52_26797 [Blattella germanica]|nr:hypothetical protein C0J52_26797 [Blattella germanica]